MIGSTITKNRQLEALIKYTLYVLTLLTIMIDLFNGLFVLLGLPIPVSLISKFIYVSLAMLILTRISKQLFLSFYSIAVFIFFIVSINEVLSGSEKFVLALSNSFKLFLPIISFFAVGYIARANSFYFSKFEKALVVNFVFLLIGVFLGLLGLGNATYSDGSGIKGVFVAGNEVGACFVALFTFVLSKYGTTSKFNYVLINSLGFVFAVSLSTKSVLLAFFLINFFYIYYFVCFKNNKLIKLRLIILILLVTVSAALIGYYLASFLGGFNFLERLYYILENRGFIELMLSGRERFISDLWAINGIPSLLSILFGNGVSFYSNEIAKYSSEVDPFDVYSYFGLIVLLSYLSFILYLILNTFLIMKKNICPITVTAFVSNIILFLMAFFSGHVWLSGMLGIIIGTINGLSFAQRNVE